MKKEKGICRRCKKFTDKHYGEKLFCYSDSKSQEKFVSYKWKKASKIKMQKKKITKRKILKKKDYGIRRNKDLKVLQSHIYNSYGGDCLSIQIMDRKTGKVFAGNIHKTFNSEKQWKNRYGE